MSDKRAESHRDYEKRTTDAWKENAPTAPTGDKFHDAVMVLHEKYDTGPLLTFLRSDRALSSADRENLARLIDLLHAVGQARRAGKPGGKHLRWRMPNYIAAYLVERRLAALKQNGRRYISAGEKQKEIDEVMSEMKGWALTQGKRQPDSERILELLRGSKKLRL
jgi:hypothetical protein